MENVAKRLQDYTEVQKLLDEKKEIKNRIAEELGEAYQKIEDKYNDALCENAKALDKYKDFLAERSDNISIYSKFNRDDIIDALLYVLSEVNGCDFIYHYAEVLKVNDTLYPLLGVGIIAPKDVFETLHITPKTSDEYEVVNCPKEQVNDLIVFRRFQAPMVTDDEITFYWDSGRRVVDVNDYDCVYDFIDCLVDYRWISEREDITSFEIMNRAKQFVDGYAKKEEKSKNKVKNKKGN